MPETIAQIKSRQVYDSRGLPSVEVDLVLSSGYRGHFITPSGASVGSREALELRDGDKRLFLGKGVSKALANIQGEISQALIGRPIHSLKELDDILISLDGTDNKSRLGANAILPVSAAFFKALANSENRLLYEAFSSSESYVLPLPLINVINGGAHANNGLDIQEFMIVPAGAKTFSESLRYAQETFYALKSILTKKGHSVAVGDEGGFAPKLKSNVEALDLLAEAIKLAGFVLGEDILLALDVAANEMYEDNKKAYLLDGKLLSSHELFNWYEKISKSYPIFSIEDPFFESDYEAYSYMMKKMGDHLQVVGDDLFVSNEKFIRMGIEHHYANAVLIKMNQVGTISETINAVRISKEAGFTTIISHRSGETEDTTIADLAVLLRCEQIKTGSMSRSERMAKYNRLLRIEEELGSLARFKGL